MDIFGTIAGVVGVYCACLQVMDQIDDARNFTDDSARLRTLFESEKLILIRWGDRVGITNKSKCQRDHRLNKDSVEYPLVYDILKRLQNAWKRAEDLFEKAGVGDRGVSGAIAIGKGSPSVSRKLIWAVRDKKHFMALLTEVGTLIQKLDGLIPDDATSNKLMQMEGTLKELEWALKECKTQQDGDRKVTEVFQDKITTHIETDENSKLLAWVGTVSTDYELNDAFRGIHDGTCTWIRSNQCFLDWFGPPDIAGTSSPVLWLHGGPGIGKTLLSASIIKYLKMHSSSYPTAFFMSAHADSSKNQTIFILRSLVCQLMEQSRLALHTVKKMKPESGDAVPTTLWEIFRAILAKLGPCYLIIDGYDECLDYDPESRSSRKGALRSFIKELLMSTESTEAKVMIVSRNLDSIRSGLHDCVRESETRRVVEYPITKADTQPDIELVSRDIAKSMAEDVSRTDKISDQLAKGCDGMFLWLRLVHERLEPGMPYEDVQEILTSAPDGLDQAYDRNFLQISQMSNKDSQRAIDILQIILFATRPLSVIELLAALKVKDAVERGIKEPPHFIQAADLNNLSFQALILKPCCSLVEIRKGEGKGEDIASRLVHFVHFSVEFLLKRMHQEHGNQDTSPYHFDLRYGDDMLHKICLSYMFIRSNFKNLCDDPFYSYSKTKWKSHFNRLTGISRLKALELQKGFFGGPYFKEWVKEEVAPKLMEGFAYTALSTMSIIRETNIRPHETAAILSLPDLCTLLLPHDEQPPQKALSYAVGYGDSATVRALLQERDDLDVNWNSNGYTWMPLRIACTRVKGRFILEMLLEREDLNVNLPLDEDGNTALHISLSSREGSLFLTKLLSRKGVDVNIKNNRGETPLHRFCYSEDFTSAYPINRLLARKDIDLNSFDHLGRTPAHAVCTTIIACSAPFTLFLSQRILKHLLGMVGVNILDKSGMTDTFRLL